ncbi:MAG: hypothetical protein ACOC2W_03225 [bacterium]
MSNNTDNNDKVLFRGTQNVWIKRLGLIILLLFSGVFNAIPGGTEIIVPLIIVFIVFAVIAYIIKMIRGFFKSFWY